MNDVALSPIGFSDWQWITGKIAVLDRQFPSYLSAWDRGIIQLEPGDTHFGYIYQGRAQVWFRDDGGRSIELILPEGMAFSLPGEVTVGGAGKGIVVSREKWKGLRSIVGPIEREGRLKYIDGCTDSLLISPVKLGDPCLNLLYFPTGIDQTAHTHPSDRIGMVLSGKGLCHAWNRDDETGEMIESKIDLIPGMIFTIHTNGKHKFSTPYGQEMRVLAYHPDSDFGPQDENHPMLNRTIVDGRSAKEIKDIHTK